MSCRCWATCSTLVELLVAFRTDATAELLAQGRRIAALEKQLAAGVAR